MFFNADYQGLKIYLFYGKKGSGKSLYQAYLVLKLIKSYYKVEKKFPKLSHRKLYINQPLSKEFEKKELYDKKTNPTGHLIYWTNPEQLYNVRDADILWDEIGKDLPAGAWTDTPKDLKQVFSHLRKRGNRIFANTQVYEDIDISFRRQIDAAWRIKKMFGNRDISASLPPPKRIWGVVKLRPFNPEVLEVLRDEVKRTELEDTGFPKFIFIRNKLVNLYDTTAELPPYQPNKLKEIILTCREGDKCSTPHKDGTPHRVVKHILA
jgi:hypothetical protein